MGRGDQLTEILLRSEGVSQPEMIGHGIAEVAFLGAGDRGQPQHGRAQGLDGVEALGDVVKAAVWTEEERRNAVHDGAVDPGWPLLREIGGYDTAHWPGEDTILCLEIARRARLVYDPWVAAAHHRRPLFGPHLRQVSRYARHRGYFAKKFPETSRRLAYFVPSLLLLGTIGTAFCAALAPLGRLPAVLAAAGGGVLALYLAAVLAFSFSTRLRVWAWTAAGTVATHFAYGWNFLRGLSAKSMPDGVKDFDHQGKTS
jgi:hypothetical protein